MCLGWEGSGSAPALQPFPCLALGCPGWRCIAKPVWEGCGIGNAEPQNIWMRKAIEPGAARTPGEGAEEMGRKMGELVKRSTWV